MDDVKASAPPVAPVVAQTRDALNRVCYWAVGADGKKRRICKTEAEMLAAQSSTPPAAPLIFSDILTLPDLTLTRREVIHKYPKHPSELFRLLDTQQYTNAMRSLLEAVPTEFKDWQSCEVGMQVIAELVAQRRELDRLWLRRFREVQAYVRLWSWRDPRVIEAVQYNIRPSVHAGARWLEALKHARETEQVLQEVQRAIDAFHNQPWCRDLFHAAPALDLPLRNTFWGPAWRTQLQQVTRELSQMTHVTYANSYGKREHKIQNPEELFRVIQLDEDDEVGEDLREIRGQLFEARLWPTARDGGATQIMILPELRGRLVEWVKLSVGWVPHWTTVPPDVFEKDPDPGEPDYRESMAANRRRAAARPAHRPHSATAKQIEDAKRELALDTVRTQRLQDGFATMTAEQRAAYLRAEAERRQRHLDNLEAQQDDAAIARRLGGDDDLNFDFLDDE